MAMAPVTPVKKNGPFDAWTPASSGWTSSESEEHEHRRYQVRISDSKLTYRYSYSAIRHRRVTHRRSIGSFKCSSCANRVADKWRALVLRMTDVAKDSDSTTPSLVGSGDSSTSRLTSTGSEATSDEAKIGDNLLDKKSVLDKLGAAASNHHQKSTPSQDISSWLSNPRLLKIVKHLHKAHPKGSTSSASTKSSDSGEGRKAPKERSTDLIAAAGSLAAVAVPSYASDLKGNNTSRLLSENAFGRSLSTSSTGTTSSFLSSDDAFSPLKLTFLLQGGVEEVCGSENDSSTSTAASPQPIIESPGDTPVQSPTTSGPLATSSPLIPHIQSFEQKTSKSTTKIVTPSYTKENSQSSNSEVRKVKAGDRSVEESTKSVAVKSKVEADGVTKEQAKGKRNDSKLVKHGEFHEETERRSSATASTIKSDISGVTHSHSTVSMQESKSVRVRGNLSESHLAHKAAQLAFTSDGLTTAAIAMASHLPMGSLLLTTSSSTTIDQAVFDELDKIIAAGQQAVQADVEKAANLARKAMVACIGRMKSTRDDLISNLNDTTTLLDSMHKLLLKAWSVKTYGHAIGMSLCDSLRSCGGLDVLIDNCASSDGQLMLHSAKILEQCLTAENRAYLAVHANGRGLEKVLAAVSRNHICPSQEVVGRGDLSMLPYDHDVELDYSRVKTGILENLFKDSEGTCGEVVEKGGLDVILTECRKPDVETLRHCASALANLSLYGGSENQQLMIKHNVPTWLFHLAFHFDDNVKYYAFLAIAAMVANKEIEAEVIKSETLDLVEPFITTHTPDEFAHSTVSHSHGQSKNWLQRLVPVLLSKRHEARALAAFHFAMEAGIKKKQGQTEIFKEIKAVEALKRVASSPVAIASKYAAQALRLIGEEVPHKLSLQVPTWSTEDVKQWVDQMGFASYAEFFEESKVDGDLLLQMTEEMLRDDAGIRNGLLRRRFMRELANLKKIADYSSCDVGNINSFLLGISPELSQYTYQMIQAGVDSSALKTITDDQLAFDCGISNSFHRLRIFEGIRIQESELSAASDDGCEKNLDVFISYRRSNGSQLASLLKVHMQVKGFSAFLDVERLEAGKFDNNLLQSIKQAKHFFLVLTPDALDRCVGDDDRKDWVHKEICCALENGCNIIPITDNFQWPEPEKLPEDMRAISYFNGVRWIHDYQDACVDKLVRFMNAESTPRSLAPRDIDNLTPGTPSTYGSLTSLGPGHPRTPFRAYQRTQSNESDELLFFTPSSGRHTALGCNGSQPPIYFQVTFHGDDGQQRVIPERRLSA